MLKKKKGVDAGDLGLPDDEVDEYGEDKEDDEVYDDDEELGDDEEFDGDEDEDPKSFAEWEAKHEVAIFNLKPLS